MSARTSPDLTALAAAIGHQFADIGLLRTAITHPSALTRNSGRRGPRQTGDADNQRLEFLGDRILGLVVAEMLFRNFPHENEGALAKRLAALVRQDGLSRVAKSIDLGKYLIMSRGEIESGGRDNPASQADACEAVIGAIYLDAGLEPARHFIMRMWSPMMNRDAKPPQDSKTALQEWAQAGGLPLPSYDVLESSGPPHDPVFTVSVTVEGHPPTSASGRSKRTAEQAAAAAFMARLRGQAS
ncbi:MAG TPA: ribonuclease III [Terriglobia bacterium]|nr:ribonuclease III [Terriglobia bacterium]